MSWFKKSETIEEINQSLHELNEQVSHSLQKAYSATVSSKTTVSINVQATLKAALTKDGSRLVDDRSILVEKLVIEAPSLTTAQKLALENSLKKITGLTATHDDKQPSYVIMSRTITDTAQTVKKVHGGADKTHANNKKEKEEKVTVQIGNPNKEQKEAAMAFLKKIGDNKEAIAAAINNAVNIATESKTPNPTVSESEATVVKEAGTTEVDTNRTRK